ncbi:MAG: prolipoprotein diacylglyceryl transferase [Candidatus Rokuibacteriota bacterium]
MYPVLIQVGGFRLHSYGVLVAVAIFAALWVGAREARRKRFPPRVVEDLMLPVVLAGFIGGRLAHVLGWEPELLWRDPLGILAVWRGGLAIYGALLAGFGAALWFCRRRHLNMWALADALAPGIILGQGIGRLGCFLSGDSYGRPTGLPWAVTFTDPNALAPLGVPLHPAQLYELALDLALFGALWAIRRRTTFDGQLFLFYIGGYGIIRLVTEVFRGDRVELAFGLSALQAASLALLAVALVAFGRRLAGRKAFT